MSNLDLWDRISKTDPNHTKEVKIGRKFTAIDPMYQIRNVTEEFGVVTVGWGFNVQDVQYLPTDQVAVKVRFWKGDQDHYIEQWGQNGLYMDKAKSMPDTDCMKKATTDGLTKCMSYFGFNADVFFGKFDDNKYVEEQRQAHQKIEDASGLLRKIKQLLEINNKSRESFVNWYNSYDAKKDRARLKAISEESYLSLKDDVDTMLASFEGDEETTHD